MTTSPRGGLPRALRPFGPAIAHAPASEALRAGLGAGLGLLVAGLFVLSPQADLRLGLYLVAPFGASSVLLFAVPNSPLAQPWSAVVGNTSAALVGVAVTLAVPDPALRIALAVGLAIAVMILLRAVHPPAGAVAMTAAMSPGAVQDLGFAFALAPIAAGTVLLVLLAMAYARLTGRHYPLRQYDAAGPQGSLDPTPADRLGLDEGDLVEILEGYRQSLNLGVEDLARLIGAAEMRAAGRRTGALTAEGIMSRTLVCVDPDTPLEEVADLFRRHGFTALPVVQTGDRYLGLIFQIHLIRRAREDAFRLDRGFGAAMARLVARRDQPVRASDIMAVATPRATPATPVAALLPLLAGEIDAVPVLDRGRIRGIVTQTDMIAALARQSLAAPDQS
ncbi:HPP family protein [Pseudooceanicola sp. LIPI14-2-Ac024]|uniref:HPP family protein n=1 Tax=Pseudooceanicola sp. LIPI14-2-Ac024 TaxID=3344875 RepID=UPI0035D0D69E